ncbi:hypothetical protein TCARB_0757 [Thermofilum adornatum 1505]|uniref:Ribbon-helix-helix protein CopG domain-containing protein n=1 Tax=Thermofilum adornatum 1505 TaxID=697581 RepID=A0A3G1A4Z5_9CREN|nr:ribbon-helix-helix domain-containing protein [Thermofilum adornatum]AJB41809.1 hypothetical protein TCARB_0757 [Thermofilum adornatum 1505]
MARIQVNLKLDEKIVHEVERLIEEGYFKTKTEAFTEALKLLIRQYKVDQLKKILEEIREGTEKLPSVTEAVVALHEEEDLD